MSTTIVTGVGAVISADIAVPEHDREIRFYSRILRTGEDPLWRDDLTNNLGMPIIGLGAHSPEFAGLPLQWMPHIQVADVATSAQRAVDLGGSVLMHQKSDDGASQWAVLSDPNGAAFGIIPVVSAEQIAASGGAPDPGDEVPVGRILWLDLTVPDAASTRDFYREVVGWSVEDVPIKHGDDHYADYNMLGESGTPAAGVCHARGVNVGLPPVWMIYLPVGDLEESLRRVEEDGGKVVKAQRGKDGTYAYAAIQDAVGVYLSLTQA